MADLESAIAYVQYYGSPIEQAQLRYVLTGSPVSPEICAAFLEDQYPEGSRSPFWPPHAASIDATCYHLIQAEYMGLLASAYLLRYLKDDGTLPSFVYTQWLAASLWYYLDQHEPAYRVFSSLQKRLEGDVSAGNLVWLIASLYDARVPMTHPLLENVTHLLEQKQKEDGRWESDDGPPFDVRTTLEVIRVMLLGK